MIEHCPYSQESVLAPNHKLRACAHNQGCFDELMEIREHVLQYLKTLREVTHHTQPDESDELETKLKLIETKAKPLWSKLKKILVIFFSMDDVISIPNIGIQKVGVNEIAIPNITQTVPVYQPPPVVVNIGVPIVDMPVV